MVTAVIPVIMSKMPPEIRVQIARNTAREVWEMSELLEVIRQEVEAREISDGVKTNVNLDKQKESSMKRPSSSTLFSAQDGTHLSSRRGPMKCVYCGGSHYSASCEDVIDPNARFEILKGPESATPLLLFGIVLPVASEKKVNSKTCKYQPANRVMIVSLSSL